MKNEVNIGITGFAGTGKSTIAKIINNALIAAGFENIVLYDTEATIPKELLETRTNSLKSKIKVNIGTHQMIRLHSTD